MLLIQVDAVGREFFGLADLVILNGFVKPMNPSRGRALLPVVK